MAIAKKLHVRKGDTVMVISGKDAGIKGKVLVALPQEGKVVVEGAAMVTRHRKPRNQGDAGGRIEQEAAMPASKVMLYCTRCNKPVRTGTKITADGKKARICKKCGETFDN